MQLSPDWYLKIRLKLKHLQLLAALDDQRNLKRAASSIGLTQPAASRLLGDLETMLKEDLFWRHPRGVEPNVYGETLIRHARAVLSELGQAGDRFSALRQGASGTVAVGTVTGPAVSLLTPALEAVLRLHPRLQISIQVETSDVLAKGILANTLDFAIARIPKTVEPAAFEYEEIGEERICVICAPNHPLLKKNPVPIRALTECTWVLQPRGSLLRTRVERLFLSKNLPVPLKFVETASVLMSMALVAKTNSVTAVADAVTALYSAGDRFVVLPIAERLTVEPYGLLQRRNRQLSPGAKILQAEIRARIPKRTTPRKR